MRIKSFVLCGALAVGAFQSEASGLSKRFESLVNYQNGNSGNLLVNGSFELGLGAAPFYPGWMVFEDVATGISTPLDSPPLPVVDKSEAHSGKRSLKLQINKPERHALLYIAPPVIPDDPSIKHYVTFWAKAEREIEVYAEISGKKSAKQIKVDSKTIGRTWQKIVIEFSNDFGLAPSLRLRMTSDKAFQCWIDDVSWSINQPLDTFQQAHTVDIVLAPKRRQGFYYHGERIVLDWRSIADKRRKVVAFLSVKDLTRNKTVIEKAMGLTGVGTKAQRGTIPLPTLKRGHYLVHLGAFDPKTKKLLGVGREK